MRLKHSATAALVSLCLPLAAGSGDWAPVTPEIWQMKASDPGNDLGAVFLIDEVRLGNRDTEYRLRIRIMSEAGKAAANIATFPSNLNKLEGRTVHADGTVVAFDSVKDFGSQTLKSDGFEENHKVLIPPGLTDNCVVDIHWTLSDTLLGHDDGGGYFGSRWFDVVVPRAFPVKRKVIQRTNWAPMSSVVVGFGSHPPVVDKQSSYQVYTFNDVPAFEDIPYSIPITRERATLYLYWQPSILAGKAQDPNAYWSYWAKEWLSKWMGSDLKAGRKYKAYLAKVGEGLPADPIQKASAVISRIQKDILNVNAMTAEQAKARTKDQEKEEIDADDLNATVSKGWTSATGVTELAFKALQDLGLSPKLAYVVDRNDRIFHSNVPSVFQFSDYFITVASADGKSMAWFDPGNLLLPPGVIPSAYQGTPALEVNSADWSIRSINVPIQSAQSNTRTFKYDLSLQDGRESCQIEAGFTGIPLWVERDKYYRLERAEQDKRLKEAIQGDLSAFQVTKSEILNAQDLSKKVGWTAEAGRDLDDGRKLVLSPFPGMQIPYWMPSTWPASRSTVIALPYGLTQTAVSAIHVPEGYRVGIDKDIDEQNAFGSVKWKTSTVDEGKGKLVTIEYRVEAYKALAGAGEYDDFKTFLGWVEHAYTRALNLQKER